MNLISLDDIALNIGGPLLRMTAENRRKWLRRKVKLHKIPYSKIGREVMLRPEFAEQLIDCLTQWPSSSSRSKDQKSITSAGRSVAARSSKALASIPNA
jgi:hypothetical protein